MLILKFNDYLKLGGGGILTLESGRGVSLEIFKWTHNYITSYRMGVFSDETSSFATHQYIPKSMKFWKICHLQLINIAKVQIAKIRRKYANLRPMNVLNLLKPLPMSVANACIDFVQSTPPPPTSLGYPILIQIMHIREIVSIIIIHPEVTL